MRVKSLDAFKAIAAYVVILLHYGVLSGYALAVGRMADEIEPCVGKNGGKKE